MAQDTLLVYPKYGTLFKADMDAINLQTGGVVSQEGRPLGVISQEIQQYTDKIYYNRTRAVCYCRNAKEF